MSPHYLVKIAQILHLFHLFTCIEYQFAIRTSCGTAASYCDVSWISAKRGGWYSWSVAKKSGSMYPCRRWSLWTFAVTLLAWHCICQFFSEPPMSTHNRLISDPPTLGETHIPSVRWKCCAFYKVVGWHFSGVVDKGATVCFLLR